MQKLTVFFIVWLWPCLVFSQQAWTREKGHFYSQIGISWIQYNSLLNGGDTRLLTRDVTDVTIQAYNEYGITDRLTVGGIIPLKYIKTANNTLFSLPSGSKTAFSNIQTSLTWNFWRKTGWVTSAKVNVGLPTATFDANTGIRTGFDATSVAPSLLAGYGSSKFFTSAEAGWVYRTNGYSKRVLFNAQIGKWLNKRLIGILGLEIMDSLEGGSFDDSTARQTGLYLNEQSYLSPNLKFGFKTSSHTTLWLGLGGGVSALTTAVAAAPGLTLSFSEQN